MPVLYRDLLREACARETVAVWSYCLMPNHVHLILTPATPEGLGRAESLLVQDGGKGSASATISCRKAEIKLSSSL